MSRSNKLLPTLERAVHIGYPYKVDGKIVKVLSRSSDYEVYTKVITGKGKGSTEKHKDAELEDM